MPGRLPDVDPNGLLEYSVVYTDRSLNHMSQSFQGVMRSISTTLKEVYEASAVAVVPGGGTYAMEAVARQFANGKKCMVIRNGWFSFRWSQILATGGIASDVTVHKAQKVGDSTQAPFEPAVLAGVVDSILTNKPDILFAPHVETASGMILPDLYIREVGRAVRSVGGLLVLDCIASGTIWANMKDLAVDVLISAPQKGWSGTPCAGLVMLGERAEAMLEDSQSTSFACDLKKWRQIMAAYENGGHAYHATMPTDGLVIFEKVMRETKEHGWQNVKQAQEQLGSEVRSLLREHGFQSVAAEGYEAPGVVVCYTDDPDIHNGRKFKEVGVQIAAGVPLRCNEAEDFQTFRMGLFGLDKLLDINRTVRILEEALKKM